MNPLSVFGATGSLLVLAAGAAAALVVTLQRVRQEENCRMLAKTYLSQGFEALSLGVGVDVGSDEEPDDVEEWHPGVLREELLGEGKRQRRGDPADLHDREEASLDGGADLVEGTRASDNGHRRQVDDVLDGGHLCRRG